ncbi:MAG: peptidase U32 family protein [Candidatus Micrarchaeota archaeon]
MKPELLAPAGNAGVLKAVVEAGADAVYLGTNTWNARLRARNFTREEIVRALAYCRKEGVHAYVTLNTLTFERELSGIAEFVKSIYEYGADALIVQDLGVAKIARDVAPDLALHASTQMSTHNSKSAGILKKLGFSRIILARELSLEQVKKIKENTGVETEVFCHGALCYSYSGKCLISFVQTGRSGNRGACAQLCRLPWKLICDGREMKKGYLTSTRDLNLLLKIPEIADSGIDALKIEGRLKSAGYMGKLVKAYRRMLDGDGVTDLSRLSGRGYTEGYLFGAARKEKLTNSEGSAFTGVKIGEVRGVSKEGARLKLFAPLSIGDSIRSSGSGKMLEVFRLYVNGKEVKSAQDICELKIKTLKKGEMVYKVEREAETEDESFLKRVKDRQIRCGHVFSFKSEPLSFAPLPELAFAENAEEAEGVAMGSAAVVSIDEVSDELAKEMKRRGVKLIPELPRVVFDEEMGALEKKMKEVEEFKPLAFMSHELSLVSDYPTVIGAYANVSNTLAAREWMKLGNVTGIIASIEVPKSEALALGFAVDSQKKLELMISENDLQRELECKGNCELVDPRGKHFKIKRKFGRTVIEGERGRIEAGGAKEAQLKFNSRREKERQRVWKHGKK